MGCNPERDKTEPNASNVPEMRKMKKPLLRNPSVYAGYRTKCTFFEKKYRQGGVGFVIVIGIINLMVSIFDSPTATCPGEIRRVAPLEEGERDAERRT